MTRNITIQVVRGNASFEGSGTFDLVLEDGVTNYIVGANGGGKTRLAVYIERQLQFDCHRISAHRSIGLNEVVDLWGEDRARAHLISGQENPNHGKHSRWGYDDISWATAMSSDFQYLVQLMFAEQNNKNQQFLSDKNFREKEKPGTIIDGVIRVWDKVLPDRKLFFSADKITVAASTGVPYAASAMSDGERSVFYLIGQVLAAKPGTVLIFDEPELHIHKAILARLWDQLEAARPDCPFVMISHDLDFVASRNGPKWVVKSYEHPDKWDIEAVPEGSGFSEELATQILGSRRPVLFVEGEQSSFDLQFYRACYPDWLVIPRGSCENVIHAVKTMRANSSFTRITCAGIVDADGRNQSQIAELQGHGIEVLPVSEIENLLLLPTVVRAMAEDNHFKGDELDKKVHAVTRKLVDHATETNRRDCALEYCRRRIDRHLKLVDLSAGKSADEIVSSFESEVAKIDVRALIAEAETQMANAVTAGDAAALLRWYDNKGVLSVAALARDTTLSSFKDWVLRIMQETKPHPVVEAIKVQLPTPKAA
ncbi:AAA family ATPase [Devosia sp. MC521]|uniref:AAA family ATPase n=1 Tax=Devosia sp. MC521 TaxID=2759954 RepID=UPI0015FA146C|nr:AAA family ATPase [Devosia sp. MC521]MBJ6985917.1 AAA family ATPase [Devosia sp. MC521]QMW61294.1 AAA family ATPase [Devosia sp. MC521]